MRMHVADLPRLWPPREGSFCYISAVPDAGWVAETPRTLTLLGSTGSIGVNALRVIEAHPQRFHIQALAGARNVRLLAAQAARWRPRWLGVLDSGAADALRDLLPAGYHPDIVTGPQGYARLASLPEVSTVLSAQVGAAGLRGTVAAALAGKTICLANKESLVLAGGLLRDLCTLTGACILPVDSEHNAVFQCLAGRHAVQIKRILITASGGPFRGYSHEQLAHVTREQALKHPNWSMGAKITIDSATLMNKGLEIMEAFHLYGAPLEAISAIIHPQSIVHALVEYQDGALLAQLGTPDMRMAIAHCLTWPCCEASGVAPLDLEAVGMLSFQKPDTEAFPCLNLAKRALAERGGQSVVLNAANEVAVESFLAGRIAFNDIPVLLRQALDAHLPARPGTPLCPPLTTADPDQVHTLLRHIETLDAQTRADVRGWIGPQE